MAQLSSAGVSAVHGYTSGHIEDIKDGKFRFGVLLSFYS